MAANIGSVFLGDHARLSRHFSNSTSTPPSSPPPTGMANYGARASTSPLAQHSFEDLDLDDADTPKPSTSKPTGNEGLNVDLNALPPAGPRKPIDSQLALELRVRWLEAIVCGLSSASSNASSRKGVVGRGKGKGKADAPGMGSESLVRLAENAQRELEAAVEGNEGLKKFMDHCACAMLALILASR